MKRISKTVLALVIASGTHFSTAEEVQSTKITADGVLQKFYGSAELRHYGNIKMKGDNYITYSPMAQLRPKLGMKLLDEKLDASVYGKFSKENGSTNVIQGQPHADIGYALYSGTYLSISPALDLDFPAKGKSAGTSGNLGANATLQAPIETNLGTVTPILYVEGGANLTSRQEDAVVNNESSRSKDEALTLLLANKAPAGKDKDGNLAIANGKKDHSVGTSYQAALGWATPLSGLTTEARVFVNQSYDPTYTLSQDDTIDTTYKATTETLNKINVSYKVTDKLTIANDFVQAMGGVYGSRRSEGDKVITPVSRYTSVAKFSYTLF